MLPPLRALRGAPGVLGIRDIQRDKTKQGLPRAIFGLVMGVVMTVLGIAFIVMSWPS